MNRATNGFTARQRVPPCAIRNSFSRPSYHNTATPWTYAQNTDPDLSCPLHGDWIVESCPCAVVACGAGCGCALLHTLPETLSTLQGSAPFLQHTTVTTALRGTMRLFNFPLPSSSHCRQLRYAGFRFTGLQALAL